jgi:hypothetical protein
MTNAAGIEIPWTSPVFLAEIFFHVVVGLCAVVWQKRAWPPPDIRDDLLLEPVGCGRVR